MKIINLLTFFILASCAHPKIHSSQALLATSWFQNASEVKALQYQAFNAATTNLKKVLKAKRGESIAVVLDIDETVLDNSPHSAKGIKENFAYPTQWKEWIESSKAEAIPGAKEFLDFANSKGVHLYYISNRKERALEATVRNLEKVKFPYQKEHIFLRSESSKKEKRRQKVKQEIVMLIGDALGDFGPFFEHKTMIERESAVDQKRSLFGSKFIVLPNPMYGEWEGAIYKYDWKKTSKEKRETLKSNLKAF